MRRDLLPPARRNCQHELLEAMRFAPCDTDTVLLQYLPALTRPKSLFLAQTGADDRHLEVLLIGPVKLLVSFSPALRVALRFVAQPLDLLSPPALLAIFPPRQPGRAGA